MLSWNAIPLNLFIFRAGCHYADGKCTTVSASTSDCAGKANEKKCTKAGCVWDDVEGSCSDSPTVEIVLAGSAIDEAETLDKPNSGVVTTASAWGIMTAVVMMWFVA